MINIMFSVVFSQLEKQKVNLSQNKQINHFFEYNNSIYISTNYGVSVYDLQALEFGDTYYIGQNGAQVQVNQTYIKDFFGDS